MDRLVTFYRLIPDCRSPSRADKSVGGTIPTRAFRYCEALRQASAFGWYLFPPMSFALRWGGGREVWWQYDGSDEWSLLDRIQFPGFAQYFDAHAPSDIREYSPPFLVNTPDPGVVQVWTGYLARTAPEWSLLIRPVANLLRNQSVDFYEGIVETDRWFGPLFTNVRLMRTNIPISFPTEYPLIQVQPVHCSVYAGEALNDIGVVERIEDLERADWDRYGETVVQRMVPTRQIGDYATAARQRAKGEQKD